MTEGRGHSRRELLAAVTGVATVGFAGCSGGGTSDSPSDDSQGTTEPDGNQTDSGGENGQETDSRPPEITVDWDDDVSINPHNPPTALELGTIDSEGSFAYDVSVGGETVAEELGFSDQSHAIRIGSSAISELPTAPGNYTVTLSGLENGQDIQEGEITVEQYLSITTPESAVTVAPEESAEVTPEVQTNLNDWNLNYTTDGETVSEDSELTFEELAERLEPGTTSEITATTTAENNTATDTVEVLLEEPEINGSLNEIAETLESSSETIQANATIETPVETEYRIKIDPQQTENPIILDENTIPPLDEEQEVEFDINYQNLINQLEPGEYTIQLETSPTYTEETTTQDSHTITLQPNTNIDKVIDALQNLPDDNYIRFQDLEKTREAEADVITAENLSGYPNGEPSNSESASIFEPGNLDYFAKSIEPNGEMGILFKYKDDSNISELNNILSSYGFNVNQRNGGFLLENEEITSFIYLNIEEGIFAHSSSREKVLEIVDAISGISESAYDDRNWDLGSSELSDRVTVALSHSEQGSRQMPGQHIYNEFADELAEEPLIAFHSDRQGDEEILYEGSDRQPYPVEVRERDDGLEGMVEEFDTAGN
jgi:hypothetical protein